MTASRAEWLALALLALLCLAAFSWPVWRAQFFLEIDLKEAWVAFQVRALRLHDLYPPANGIISNNYPPLFFLLVDLVAGRHGDVIIIGRVLSLIATGVNALCIAVVISRFNGSAAGAILGALWFVGTLSRYSEHYVGMNDPELLGLAFMMIGLTLIAKDRVRWMWLGLFLVVAGGFFKNSLVATPLAALYLVFLTRGLTTMTGAMVLTVMTSIAGLAICAFCFGPNFLPQLLFYPRDISLWHALASLERLGSFSLWPPEHWPTFSGNLPIRSTSTPSSN